MVEERFRPRYTCRYKLLLSVFDVHVSIICYVKCIVNPQLSEPRLSGSQNYLAHDTWIMQLLHQRTYTVYTACAFSVAHLFCLLEDGSLLAQ